MSAYLFLCMCVIAHVLYVCIIYNWVCVCVCMYACVSDCVCCIYMIMYIYVCANVCAYACVCVCVCVLNNLTGRTAENKTLAIDSNVMHTRKYSQQFILFFPQCFLLIQILLFL